MRCLYRLYDRGYFRNVASMKGFMMNLETAEKFYKRCAELGAVTEDERLSVMYDLIHEENVKILDEKGLAKALAGKKALIVRKKP